MKLLILSALLAAFPLSAPARPFTNQKGKSFEATVVSVDSTIAELTGMDGIGLVIKHGSRIVATHTTGRVSKELPLEMMK